MTHHHQAYAALSYCRTLFPHGRPLARWWRIERRYTHACNLRSDQGHHLAIVSPQHGNGPFHVVAPLAVLTQLPDIGCLEWVGQQLHSAQVTVCLQTVHLWEPHLPASPRPLPWSFLAPLLQPYAQRLQILLAPPQTGLPGLAARLEAGTEALTRGLHTSNLDALSNGIEQLAGLGPGLTPAGDDLLLGVLAGLWLGRGVRWPTAMVQAVGSQIERLAIPRTTSLSATWLHHAAQGEFGEAWHRLTQALSSQQRPTIQSALDPIAASGATSGLAALTGLALCCSAR